MQTLQKTVQIGNVDYIMKMHIKDNGFDVEMMNVITKDKYMVCHNVEYMENLCKDISYSYSIQFNVDTFKQMLVKSMEGHELFNLKYIMHDNGNIYVIFYVRSQTIFGLLPATSKWNQICGICLEYVPPSPVGDKLAEKIVSIETRMDKLEIMIKKINNYLDGNTIKRNI
jgi:hypothetical protein